MLVKINDKVTKKQQIGTVGNTTLKSHLKKTMDLIYILKFYKVVSLLILLNM